MRIIDVGSEPVGIVAIGQNATGVIAIGQLATGVIAIGQVARGVIVIGQVAIGVAAFGQLVVALTYGGGMVGVAGLRTAPSLIVWGVAGEGHVRRAGRWRFTAEWRRTSAGMTALRVAVLAAIAVAVTIVALSWFPDFVDDEPEQPPPTTYEPGSR